MLKKIIIESRRIEEDSLYSAKGNFNASMLWSRVHYVLGIPITILTTFAGASSLSQIDNAGKLVGVLALAAAVLASISTFINPNKKADTHLYFGNKYLALSKNIRIFHEIECAMDKPVEELFDKLQSFSIKRNKLNGKCPIVPMLAFWLAKKGIEKGEANYRVDQK